MKALQRGANRSSACLAARTKTALAVVMLALFSACIPTEKPILIPVLERVSTPEDTQVNYKGFSGITAAHTAGATKINATWNASADPSVVAYKIYDVSNIFEPVLLKTVPVPNTSVNLIGMLNGNLYTLRVRAANAQNVEDTNTATAQAIPYGGVISATVVSATSASLSYYDPSMADQVNVYCTTDGTTRFSSTPLKVETNVNTTSTTLTGLTPGTRYICRVALQINGYADDNTQTVSFTPIGQATQLVFSSQPGGATAGVPLAPQPVVKIMDSNGNVVSAGPDSTALITLALSSNSPTIGSLRGTIAVAAVGGVATFTGINIREAGAKILTASKGDTSAQTYGSGPLTAESNPFTISAGSVAPNLSSISVSPSGPLVANGSASYAVSMQLNDQYGNPVSGIKPIFASSSSADTVIQSLKVTDSSGIAAGSITSTVSGTRTISITSPSGLTSNSTPVTFIPGPPAKLAFYQQPINSPAGNASMNQIQVAVQDSYGNVVTSGTGSNASIALGIFVNAGGGSLSGTTTSVAVNGIATFTGLGINKTGTGYKLVASTPSPPNETILASSFSNAFNVTAGVPAKVSLSGPVTLLSGSCSSAFTLQIQDSGGNPSKVQANTMISIRGLGNGQFYSSSVCAGSPVSTIQNATCSGAGTVGQCVQFATGSDTKTIYFKDMKAESLDLSAVDPSGVMSSGAASLKSTPALVALSGPSNVVAGKCSAPFSIVTSGMDQNPGNVASNTPFSISGITGSQAKLYSDASCSTLPLNPSSITVTSGTSITNFYLKDDRSESLNLAVLDTSAVLATSSTGLDFKVLPSNISFTGPSSVVSGKCSSVFTVTIQDSLGYSVSASANTALTINGLAGKQGNFYSTSNCSGSPLNGSVIVPEGLASATMYFRDYTAETASIFISDPNQQMANSQAIDLGISPSALAIRAPGAGSSKTNDCAGPFTLNTMDGGGNVTSAISPITALLGGAGSGGAFYSDSSCTTKVSQFVFDRGENTKSFYFMGLSPETLTFAADDGATPSVLSSASQSWTVTAAPSWIGTANGILSWFEIGKKPVLSRMDGPASVTFLYFNKFGDRETDPFYELPRQFLYVVDGAYHRVLKYDYQNQKYIGWIGGFTNSGYIYPTGSNQSTNPRTGQPYTSSTLNAACVGVSSGPGVPGWCQGGQSYAAGGSPNANRTGATATAANKGGAMYNPSQMTDDGTYIYVVNQGGRNSGGPASVQRFVASTGAFTGWIGRVSSTPLGPGVDANGNSLVNSCTTPASLTTNANRVTPGWCLGGGDWSWPTDNGASNQYGFGWGDGSMDMPYAIAYSKAGYIYVGNQGLINRYVASTGQFAGWIGWLHSSYGTSGGTYTSAAPYWPGIPIGGVPNINGNNDPCTGAVNNRAAPGWCYGGVAAYNIDPAVNGGAINNPRGLYVDDTNNLLWVVDQYNSSFILSKFNLTTGAFIATVTARSPRYVAPFSIVSDGNKFYLADTTQVDMMDTSGNLLGWIGKVGNNLGLGGSSGCSSLAVNADTPGWCTGGSSRAGINELAVHNLTAIEWDGNGNLLTGGAYNSMPTIKKWDAATGQYLGSLQMASESPTQWSISPQFAGFYGFDDNSMYAPAGSYNDGTHLYVTEYGAGRIKKIELATGKTVGWIGGIASSPTGGASGCVGAQAMSFSPGWCLGAFYQPSYLWNQLIPQTANGLLNSPTALTGDSTYLYVADSGWSRIYKYNKSTGAAIGWIGLISSSPTGGATGCNGATGFTPGWCTGGTPASSSTGNGAMNYPTGITTTGGKLYVVDLNNHRVNAYMADSGAFIGWTGLINTTPTGGTGTNCTGAANTATTGWCTGGTSKANPANNGYNGGFVFRSRPGITTDGTILYISNAQANRIDKFDLNGKYISSVYTNWSKFNSTWTTSTTDWNWGGWTITQIWNDGKYLYGTTADNANVVVKFNLTDTNYIAGQVIGWQGAIAPGSSNSPSAPQSCVGATGVTPTWCQGGGAAQGYTLGGFTSNVGISGDNNYIYVSDENTHRVTRIPK